MKLIINLTSDNFGIRKETRNICFAILDQRLPNKKDKYVLNVFGGSEAPKKTDFHYKGDFTKRENLAHAFEYALENYNKDDLFLVLENDIIICYNFIDAVFYFEKLRKDPNSIISGFSHRKDTIKSFINNFKLHLMTFPNSYYGSSTCFWLRLWQIEQLYEFQKKTPPVSPKDAQDLLIRKWLMENKMTYYVTIPNIVSHFGYYSTIYSRAVLGLRETFCFLHDPMGLQFPEKYGT